MRKLLFSNIIILTITFLVSSCIKEEFDPGKLNTEIIINPGVAAPIGYIHYKLNEIVEDPDRSWEVRIDQDGLISLVYEAEVASLQASEFLYIPEISQLGYVRNTTTKTMDFAIYRFPVYNPLHPDSALFSLAGNNGPFMTDIDSIKVRSMEVTIDQSSQYDNLEGRLIIKSPNILKKYRGRWESWSMAVNLNIPPQTNIVTDCVILPVKDSEGNSVIPLIFDLRPQFCLVQVPAGLPVIRYYITINNINYSAIYGNLGKFNIPIPSREIVVDFFNTLNGGSFHFEQPQLNFYFENSFGIPIQILTNDLYATSDDGSRVDITGPGLPSMENIKIIDYPTLNELGKTAFDSLKIDQDNSNIPDAMDISPSLVTFEMEALTNTLDTDTNNFILDRSRLNVKAQLILPLYGYSDLMIVRDTIGFEFNDFFQNPPEEIQRMALRLNFTNGFPVDISTQIYFADESFAVIDSVFDERYLIDGATDEDGDGRVEPLEDDPVEVELNRSKIDNIAITRYIIMEGRLNTVDFDIPQKFYFYSDYFLDVYLGVVGDLELNSTSY